MPFTDTTGHWAETYIDWCAANGWFDGYPDGSFRPDEPLTRAEAATLIWRQFAPEEPAPEPVPGDVTLTPSDDWQALVDAAGDGATIVLAAGTYVGFKVTPRTGQTFTVDGPVVLDGNGQDAAFEGHGVQAVSILGGNVLRIHNYDTPQYHGAICSLAPGDWYNNPTWGPQGWTVDAVEIHGCSYGVTLADDNARLTNSWIHDVAEIGFKMLFGHNQAVIGCEINNITPTDWGHEGGGCKNWSTRNLLLEGNVVYDIAGPGLWNDHDNQDAIIRRNTVYECGASGIFHEISGHATIEDNVVENQYGYNGLGIWSRGGAAIHVVNSPATVRNNLVRNCGVGVAFLDQQRDEWTNNTSGEAYNNTLDNAGASGDARDHNGDQYVLGALGVDWHDNYLSQGSIINGNG